MHSRHITILQQFLFCSYAPSAVLQCASQKEKEKRGRLIQLVKHTSIPTTRKLRVGIAIELAAVAVVEVLVLIELATVLLVLIFVVLVCPAAQVALLR